MPNQVSGTKKLPFSLDLTAELAELEQSKNLTLINVGNAPAKSFLLSQILEKTHFKNVFWASTDEKADQIMLSAGLFFEGRIHLIPAEYNIASFYELREAFLTEERSLFLFEDLKAILDMNLPSESDIDAEKVSLKSAEKIKIYEVFDKLERIGYRPAEDQILKPGEFVRRGENLFIYPINKPDCYRIQLFDNEIEQIEAFRQSDETKEEAGGENITMFLEIFPIQFTNKLHGKLMDFLSGHEKTFFISDDLDADICPDNKKKTFYKIKFTTFPEEKERFFHLNFFSVLPFYTIPDFFVDIKERFRREFTIVVMTKKFAEIERIFHDNHIMFTEDLSDQTPSTVKVIKAQESEFIPHSFQNNDRKLLFLTDREIFQFHRSSRQKKAISGVNLDLMTSLKASDFVVHVDHGLAQFDGIVRRDLGTEFGTREYLKLCYAENDKLFVPVESAEKITKFIGDEEPKLTRLGSADWKRSQQNLKKEAERIAKELLHLYAAREMAEGHKFTEDDEMMQEFYEAFPYELTPGQSTAWFDVKRDMESPNTMDRLVCGDVGFGKTEIAMRAAFKCFRSGMQAVFLAPITILAEQHYRSFQKRIAEKNYGVRIELLSRFQSASEQKRILKELKLGLVDIIIGTHRLLSDDIHFKNLGLLIIDEEQRFGVKQKEKLKKFRASVDLLTLTATPIPRTLNMSLNKLKDISTITTPPPGRLPVVTEVRKYNLNLIRERILLELERNGQVYFLHNQVQTIEAQARQLETLIPEARFIVAHGQLKSQELEERIRRFKEGEADVLIASTIIENGIDLPNANTLLVNRADKFGLSQLYQLRGRVGRSRTQAYSYFLYHGQKLEWEAKKRLRAIVEASELGAGFQIAMRDLEIRGAGEILGASQAGAIKTVGVSHFMRMLQRTVDEMKSGEISSDMEEEESISVEIPLSAYIPPYYIPDANEKIQTYKELASAETPEQLEEIKDDLEDDYGRLPMEVVNLCKVILLKMHLRVAHLNGVKVQKNNHKTYEIVLRMGKGFSPDQILKLVQKAPEPWTITATALKMTKKTLSLSWYEEILEAVKLLEAEKKKPQPIPTK